VGPEVERTIGSARGLLLLLLLRSVYLALLVLRGGSAAAAREERTADGRSFRQGRLQCFPSGVAVAQRCRGGEVGEGRPHATTTLLVLVLVLVQGQGHDRGSFQHPSVVKGKRVREATPAARPAALRSTLGLVLIVSAQPSLERTPELPNVRSR
jgi:hypothetical protein